MVRNRHGIADPFPSRFGTISHQGVERTDLKGLCKVKVDQLGRVSFVYQTGINSFLKLDTQDCHAGSVKMICWTQNENIVKHFGSNSN